MFLLDLLEKGLLFGRHLCQQHPACRRTARCGEYSAEFYISPRWCADFGDFSGGGYGGRISGGSCDALSPQERRLQTAESRLAELSRRLDSVNLTGMDQENQRLRDERDDFLVHVGSASPPHSNGEVPASSRAEGS